MMIDAFLNMLDGVRKYGQRWRANCPCGHTSKGALSIAQTDDGAIMLHCFAGCTVHEITSALGIHVRDLMPARDHSPEGRRRTREYLALRDTRAAASVLAYEAEIVQLYASDVLAHRTVQAENLERFILACDRIRGVKHTLETR